MDIANIINPNSPPRPHQAHAEISVFSPLRMPASSEGSMEPALGSVASSFAMIEQRCYEKFNHSRGRQSLSKRIISSRAPVTRATLCHPDRFQQNVPDSEVQSQKDSKSPGVISESVVDENNGDDFLAASTEQGAEYGAFQSHSNNLTPTDIVMLNEPRLPDYRPGRASIVADMSALHHHSTNNNDSLEHHSRRTSMMSERGFCEQNELTSGSEAVFKQYRDIHNDLDRKKTLGMLTSEPKLFPPPGFSSKLQHPVIERLRVIDSLNWDNEGWKSPLSLEVSPALDPYSSSDLLIQFKTPRYKSPTPDVETTHNEPEPFSIEQRTAAPQETPEPGDTKIQHRNLKNADVFLPDTGSKCGTCCHSPHHKPKALKSKPLLSPERYRDRLIYSREGEIHVPHNYFLEFLDPSRLGRRFDGTQGDLDDMMRWDKGRFAEQVAQGIRRTDLGTVYTTETSESFIPRKRDNRVIISVKEINPSRSNEDEPSPKCSHSGGAFNVQVIPDVVGSSRTIDDQTIQMESPTKYEKSTKIYLDEFGLENSSGEFMLDDDITIPDDETTPEFLRRFPNKITVNAATYEACAPKKGGDDFGPLSSSPLRSRASVRFELPLEPSTPSRNTSTECVRGTPDNSPIRGECNRSPPSWSSLRKKTSAIFLRGSTDNSPASDHPSSGSKSNSPTRSDKGSSSIRSGCRSLRKIFSGSLGKSFKRRSVLDLAAKDLEDVARRLEADEQEKDPFNTKFQQIEHV